MPALTSRAAANALSGLLTRRSLLGCGLLFSASSVARAADSSGLSLPPLEDGYKRLYLCRHGETDFNLENRIQGRPDNPLNSNGQAQARALSRYLASEPLCHHLIHPAESAIHYRRSGPGASRRAPGTAAIDCR